IGVALAALSKVPAEAVQANVGVIGPAVAVATSVIGLSTAVSSGNTEIDVMLAHTTVDPLMTTLPELAPAPLQTRMMPTGVVIPADTANPAEPAQLKIPPTDVAVRLA